MLNFEVKFSVELQTKLLLYNLLKELPDLETNMVVLLKKNFDDFVCIFMISY